MDIQAQDRAHRIGQTKPVLIFRLVSKYTIEEKIMQKANEKRKLEALVIAKGIQQRLVFRRFN
jgi:ATP-dependent DNA helicase